MCRTPEAIPNPSGHLPGPGASLTSVTKTWIKGAEQQHVHVFDVQRDTCSTTVSQDSEPCLTPLLPLNTLDTEEPRGTAG